ncbi:MAG TPA: hypothetical protein VKB69_08420 [Micromonosporaceae bacterium]|nr:hypothetical protein [Micromonosporaceae bacterium]
MLPFFRAFGLELVVVVAAGRSAPLDEAGTLREAGFRGIVEADIRVEIPVPDADTLWAWFQIHGTRQFLDDLPAPRRAEFRRRMTADLESRDRILLRRYAWLFTALA